MSDARHTLTGLTSSDLVLLRAALELESARHAETQRSIRHTKRCTISEATQRYPTYRHAVASAARCRELQSQILSLLEPPG
jgi:hypothetical protein